MKAHLEETVKKYADAYAEMVKRINSNSLEVEKFMREMHLPANYIKSCIRVGLIARVSKFKFAVKVAAKSNAIGKMIADEVCKLESNRRERSIQLNS